MSVNLSEASVIDSSRLECGAGTYVNVVLLRFPDGEMRVQVAHRRASDHAIEGELALPPDEAGEVAGRIGMACLAASRVRRSDEERRERVASEGEGEGGPSLDFEAVRGRCPFHRLDAAARKTVCFNPASASASSDCARAHCPIWSAMIGMEAGE